MADIDPNKIAVELMLSSAKEVAQGVASFIGKAISEKWAEKKIYGDFKAEIKKYYTSQYQKYAQIKTFLFKGELTKFEDVYYPLSIEKEYRGYGHKPDGDIVFNSFNDLLNNKGEYSYITITGDAGSGKTTFARHLFLSAIIGCRTGGCRTGGCRTGPKNPPALRAALFKRGYPGRSYLGQVRPLGQPRL